MKKRIRVLSLIMTLAIIFSSLVIVVPVGAVDLDGDDEDVKVILTDLNTVTDGTKWTDYADFPTEDDPTLFAGGSGTAEDPYQIKTPEQLALLAAWNNDPSNYDRVNKAFYILTRDIDLAGHEWVAIGCLSGTDTRFMGGFNGNGHTISNMTVTPATTITAGNGTYHHVGLFGYVGGSNAIENFTLTGSINITTYTYGAPDNAAVGMVAARVSGFADVKNIDVYGKVSIVSTSAEVPVAGVVGMAANLDMENVRMYGSVSSYNEKAIPLAGGLTAWASGGFKAINCENHADVTIYANGTNSIAGGIVGKCGRIGNAGTNDPLAVTAAQLDEYAAKIIGCINTGNIVVNMTTGGRTPNNQRLGGIAGNIGRGSGSIFVDVLIEKCVSIGKVALGSGVTIGGASGCCKLVGLIEPFTVNNLTVKQPDGTTTKENRTFRGNTVIKQCFVPYYYDADSSSFIEPHFRASNANVNGEVVNGPRITNDCDINFAIDVTETATQAHIRFSKNTADALLAVGYELTLTYGDEIIKITDAEELAEVIRRAEDKAYVARLDLEAGAIPSLVANRKLETNLDEAHTIVAQAATWIDFYTEELKANPMVDADTYLPGSKQNPYIISTAGHLAAFSEYITKFGANDKYFAIINDIDLSAHEWAPAGMTQPNAFNGNYRASGTLLGYNHVIKNVRLTGSRYSYSQSFMGYSLFNLKDIVFDGIVIRTPDVLHTEGTIDGVCGLISAMYGGSIDNVHIKNFDMDYLDNRNLDYFYGGFVGYMNGNSIKITDSSISGKINMVTQNSNIKLGGLISRTRVGTIDGCLSNLDITITADNQNAARNIYVGGIAGIFLPDNPNETTNIKNSANTGNITINYKNNGGLLMVGGAVGAGTNVGKGILNVSNFVNAGKLAINCLDGSSVLKADTKAAVAYFLNNTVAIINCVSLTGEDLMGEKNSGSTYGEGGNHCYDLDLKAENGASLRLDATGMAFNATFDQDVYDALVDLGCELSFGMLITRTAKLDTLDGCVQLLKDGYVKVAYDEEIENGIYSGAISNIREDLLDEEGDLLSAVPYVTITKDDYTFTVYGEASEGRSAKGLANAVLEDATNYTPEELAAVREIYNIPVED